MNPLLHFTHSKYFLIITIVLLIPAGGYAQTTNAPKPVYPIPTEAQLKWHDMEINAFIHFTINTFTDKEWGYGDESPGEFNPTSLNVDQWISTLKSTGVKGVILTCKHHDGFCLWPSAYTHHSVANSPYKNGNGDLVKEVSESVKKHGLKFGLYVSPWDRNRADYGSPSYVEYYRNQLKELFTNYGPVFEMWFDGANGGDGFYGGAREKRKISGAAYYDWPQTLRMVTQMEPNVIFFSDAGPGVRWVGNEQGHVNETNWNSITPDTLYAGKSGIEKLLGTGSENGTHWIPAEVDVSIRPGWFYHKSEDAKVKTPEQLFEIYMTSVGRGSLLLLNVPPDQRGLFHEEDVKSLKGFSEILKREFKTNFAKGSIAKADSHRDKSQAFSAAKAVDGDAGTYWCTNDEVTKGSIEVNLKTEKTVKYVVAQEYIRLGQRVKTFTIEVWMDGKWSNVAEGTTIGHKRIVKIDPVKTSKVRLSITDSKACPLISEIAIF
ncbi:MAG: alpha-L-fucosidase [Chryseolinea sp.]